MPYLLRELLGIADVAFVANGQLVAALRPATSQDIAAVLCFHALAEAVSLGSLPVIRLKRTFWHCSTFPERLEAHFHRALRVGVQNSDYKGYREEVQSKRGSVVSHFES